MGAPQHQGVHPCRFQGSQVFRRHRLDYNVAGAEPAVLHQGHEQGAGLPGDPGRRVFRLDGPLIGAAAHRGLGADQADVPAAGEPGRRPGGGLHHPHHGDGILGGEHVQRGGGYGAAGDEDGLEVEGAQEGHILPGIFDDRLPGAAAVGHPSRISEVDHVLPRQQAAQLPHSGEPPQAGIKDADGPLIQSKSLLKASSGLFSPS